MSVGQPFNRMTPPEDLTLTHPPRPRTRWRVPHAARYWFVLLLGCALFAGASRFVEFRRRRHEARDVEYRLKHRDLSARVAEYLGLPKALVERHLNAGQPLREQPADDNYRYRIDGVHVAPEFGGWQVVCRFKDN